MKESVIDGFHFTMAIILALLIGCAVGVVIQRAKPASEGVRTYCHENVLYFNHGMLLPVIDAGTLKPKRCGLVEVKTL